MNGYPRPASPAPRGHTETSPAPASSSAPASWSATPGHGSAPAYGSRTVPSDWKPPATPSAVVAQLRGFSSSRSIPDSSAATTSAAAPASTGPHARARPGSRAQATTAAAPPTATATHTSARPEPSPPIMRCHSSAASAASAAKPTRRAAQTGISAAGGRPSISEVVTPAIVAPLRPPAGAARSAGSSP
jgi:hypothetical protein